MSAPEPPTMLHEQTQPRAYLNIYLPILFLKIGNQPIQANLIKLLNIKFAFSNDVRYCRVRSCGCSFFIFPTGEIYRINHWC